MGVKLKNGYSFEHSNNDLDDHYEIGIGIADITGPAAEVNMMGYAKPQQETAGIHFRLFSRAFIMKDVHGNRVCFVSADIGMIDQLITLEVIKRLKVSFSGLYDENNVMLAGTHTHSGPGGFLQYVLYIITSRGFIPKNFETIVNGIYTSIERAHHNLKSGYIYFNEGNLLNASINRSPTAYEANTEDEKSKYKYNTDKSMYLLKFTDLDNNPMGLINWFAVHPTSMNNTNHLISGDNKGYASLLYETFMNKQELPGKGPFIAAFANANLGDVSPNIKGPHCLDTGLPCQIETSTCGGSNEKCVASGPGRDMFDSTKIIATRQFEKAKELFDTAKIKVSGSVKFIHQYIDMTNIEIKMPNGEMARTCEPAMGYSFAAGTTDGPGGFDFKQGSTSSNTFWNLVRDAMSRPSEQLIKCHAPKPILLATGQMTFPYLWQPKILPTQLFQIGDLAIAGVPAEFTTMSGRRLRETIKDSINNLRQVIVSGLSNAYSSYVATPEEYQIQRYEGASTIYGPHTLTAYLQQYKKLAESLKNNSIIEPGPLPPNLLSKQISLEIGVIFDRAPFGKNFGDCVTKLNETYFPGSIVVASFVSGHPKNNFMTEKSYLTVEILNDATNEWEIIATDSSLDTKFHWKRTNAILGESLAVVEWEIPEDVHAGVYKINHYGYYKTIIHGIKPYSGETKPFKISTNYLF